MSSTVARVQDVRSKRAPVRPVQPNPEGGRPVDDLVLGFEGSFEGLVAESDDLAAICRGHAEILRVGSLQAMIERRIAATSALSAHDEQILRACRKQIARVLSQLDTRAQRLASAAIPEEQRIVRELDVRLTERAQ